MKSNKEIFIESYRKLQGNWGEPIVICLVIGILSIIPGQILNIISRYASSWFFNLQLATSLIGLTIGGIFALISCYYFLTFVKGYPISFSSAFEKISFWSSAMLLQLRSVVIIFLWSLLFVIPGIIAYYRYSQSFFILSENPNFTPKQCMDESEKLMENNKSKLFTMHLRFLGLFLLTPFTLFIGLLFLIPFFNTAMANFYVQLVGGKSGFEESLEDFGKNEILGN